MQGNNRQAGVVLGRQYMVQVHPSGFRFGAECLRVKIQMQASCNAAAQHKRLQVWHVERVLVRVVTPPSGNASWVEPLILHQNFARCVNSVDVQLFPGIFSFARELHTSGRGARLAEDGSNILEIKLAAITELPRRLRKTDKAGLRVNLTVWNFPLQLRQEKRIRPECESRREFRRKWEIPPGRYLEFLPGHPAEISRPSGIVGVIHRKLKIPAFDCQRHLRIVPQNLAVLETQMSDLQVEEALDRKLALFYRSLSRRHVRRAVPVHVHVGREV